MEWRLTCEKTKSSFLMTDFLPAKLRKKLYFSMLGQSVLAGKKDF